MCRRWVGSALVCLSVKPDDLRYGGPVQNFASSDWAERGFCGTCGSSLWYHLKAGEHESYELCAGLFEDAAGLTVTKEIYIDHKPAGFAFAGDHLRQTRAEALASYGITDPEGDD
ncbi:MAG: GFA family protein [Rhodobacteraceae bacterium]|nr:GFA family protein [Paracoccaceae bacterium]